MDEQHRFGVHQRLALRLKGTREGEQPHQLMMSATPIPRTLAMSFYADLDVSVIDELPPGRTPVVTKLLSDARRDEVIGACARRCMQGRQAYWVCPLIEESEALQLQTALETFERIKQTFPELAVGLVHGRLSNAEKAAVMEAFTSGAVQLLVATTVIEVGVDVPNASLMVIENAERMGLSQLHQLRGRVGRGAEASVCILLYQNPLSDTARERLRIVYESTDGFEIARHDLRIRGPGELLGARQSGLPMLRFADLERDLDLLEAARDCRRPHLARLPRAHRGALVSLAGWQAGLPQGLTRLQRQHLGYHCAFIGSAGLRAKQVRPDREGTRECSFRADPLSIANRRARLVLALRSPRRSAVLDRGRPARDCCSSPAARRMPGCSSRSAPWAGWCSPLRATWGWPRRRFRWCCRSGCPICLFTCGSTRWSAFFLMLLGVVSAGVSLYSAGYFEHGAGDIRLICLQYHVFLASMAMVLLADDAYLFMVAWETMALASYFLVTTDHEVAAIRSAGFLYLIVAHVGAIAILLCFGTLQLGQWNYTLRRHARQHACRRSGRPSHFCWRCSALARRPDFCRCMCGCQRRIRPRLRRSRA